MQKKNTQLLSILHFSYSNRSLSQTHGPSTETLHIAMQLLSRHKELTVRKNYINVFLKKKKKGLTFPFPLPGLNHACADGELSLAMDRGS